MCVRVLCIKIIYYLHVSYHAHTHSSHPHTHSPHPHTVTAETKTPDRQELDRITYKFRTHRSYWQQWLWLFTSKLSADSNAVKGRLRQIVNSTHWCHALRTTSGFVLGALVWRINILFTYVLYKECFILREESTTKEQHHFEENSLPPSLSLSLSLSLCLNPLHVCGFIQVMITQELSYM